MPDSASKAEVNFQIWMDPELRSKFKARCAAEGRTIKEVITEFMAKFSNEK